MITSLGIYQLVTLFHREPSLLSLAPKGPHSSRLVAFEALFSGNDAFVTLFVFCPSLRVLARKPWARSRSSAAWLTTWTRPTWLRFWTKWRPSWRRCSCRAWGRRGRWERRLKWGRSKRHSTYSQPSLAKSERDGGWARGMAALICFLPASLRTTPVFAGNIWKTKCFKS